MSDTIEKTRMVAFKFAQQFFKIGTPAIAYKGKVETQGMDGNFFTTRDCDKRIHTIVVDRKCKNLWLIADEATAEVISNPHNQRPEVMGKWTYDNRHFVINSELSEETLKQYC